MENQDSQQHEESALAPCPGYAAQPWIKEPTRAGWWWLYHPRWNDIELVKVLKTGDDGTFRMNDHAFHVWGSRGSGWRWAGPVEPPQAPHAETPHTETKISDPRKRQDVCESTQHDAGADSLDRRVRPLVEVESGNEQKCEAPDMARSDTAEIHCRLHDEALLRSAAECPAVLDGLAKTPAQRQAFRLWLDQWRAAGYPRLESSRESVNRDTAQVPAQDRVEFQEGSYE